MRIAFLLFLVFLATVQPVSAKSYADIEDPKPPYTVEGLRAWHSALVPWPWPYSPEAKVQLSESGGSQLLLCFGGGARGGEFALFAEKNNGWALIGEIDQAHHPIRVLPTVVSGWHDFQTFLPLWGSGGNDVLMVHYRWSGSLYKELSRSEGKWCDYEPFKGDPEIAESCYQ